MDDPRLGETLLEIEQTAKTVEMVCHSPARKALLIRMLLVRGDCCLWVDSFIQAMVGVQRQCDARKALVERMDAERLKQEPPGSTVLPEEQTGWLTSAVERDAKDINIHLIED